MKEERSSTKCIFIAFTHSFVVFHFIYNKSLFSIHTYFEAFHTQSSIATGKMKAVSLMNEAPYKFKNVELPV